MANRVLLGDRDGNEAHFGLYVSRPGTNVVTCNREDLIISAPDLAASVLHAQLDITISNGTYASSAVSFTGLPYIPFVLWAQVDGNTILGQEWYFNIQFFLGIIQIGGRYNCEVTINSVKIAANTGNISGNKTFRVLVFRIPAN